VPYYDDFKSDRFKTAWAIGKHADAIFRAECRLRGLDPEKAIASPLASLATTPVPARRSMDQDQILNLWHEGLSRPEILALGCHINDFVDAIRRARAVGDSRAYYRQGKSRLPWKIELTGPAKRKAKNHRIVSNEVGRMTMTRRRRPKKANVDLNGTILGQEVNDLVDIFAQIDVAKRELDKRFIPRSDVPHDNKD
jgi:hypothetical protein